MGAWAAILILTAESDNLAIGLAEQLQSVPWLTRAAATISTSIVPATVTIINAIMPIIIKVRHRARVATTLVSNRDDPGDNGLECHSSCIPRANALHRSFTL